MAKITGQYSYKSFEDDADFNAWKEDGDVWAFDGKVLSGYETGVTEGGFPLRYEYSGNDFDILLVNGRPVIRGGTISEIHLKRNENIAGSGQWITEVLLTGLAINALEYYNVWNNNDPTDNIVHWARTLSGNDTFILSDNPGGNYVRSYAGNDHITGSTGNDIIDGGSGNDTIIGGGGTDIAVFSGKFIDYNIVKLTDNRFTVQDSRGNDGTDLLQDISILRFSDVEIKAVDIISFQGQHVNKFVNSDMNNYQIKILNNTGNFATTQFGIKDKVSGAVDTITGASLVAFKDKTIDLYADIYQVFNQVDNITGSSSQVFRLYNAAFSRLPDYNGLKYWINEYNTQNIRVIADYFIRSAEFIALYGQDNSTSSFVDNLYKNILGRLPDQSGNSYWVNQIDSGKESRSNVLLGFSESKENIGLFSDVTGLF